MRIHVGAVLLLAACSSAPDFGDQDRVRDAAAYPRLVPIKGLIPNDIGIAVKGRIRATPEELFGNLQSRIYALQARAAILRGSKIDAETRERLTATQ